MRGGTSKAVMFLENDLPDDRAGWDAIFQAAIGSPDPNGRQLNGMGGGISSLSKVCVIGLSERDDADIVAPGFMNGPQDVTADAAEPVNSHSNSHAILHRQPDQSVLNGLTREGRKGNGEVVISA